MTYQEALDFIHGIARFGSKPGLRRVKLLLERLGNPQDRLRFIHVAGTNGKGSTCAMLQNILTLAGYRTGLYISPFVLDFRERIQLDGEMISQEDLADCTALVKTHWDELDRMGETATEFEVVVAIAMLYFLRRDCEVVVLEVGLGGRYDATNIIAAPLVSVITSIGLDHTEYLGETLAKVALEKCGIIKHGGVTVSAPGQDPEVLEVLLAQCAEKQNKLLIPGDAQVLRMDATGTDIRWGALELHIALVGAHQVTNALTALETVRALELTSLDVSWENVVKGIAITRFPARFERLRDNPPVYLDGAHNIPGAQALRATLELLGGEICAVVGMMRDKEIEECLSYLLPCCKALVATTVPEMPRAMPAEELAALAKPYIDRIEAHPEPRKAVERAIALAGRNGAVVICGSLYLASYVRPLVLEDGEKCKNGN